MRNQYAGMRWAAIEEGISYISTAMKTRTTLLQSNKYLRKPEIRESLIIRHAAASAKIEGVKLATKRAKRLAKSSRLGR